jgi:SAM-dependent methyltransferase
MSKSEQFFREKIIKILTEKKSVIDIGGSLRVYKDKNNRFNEKSLWLLPYLEKTDYKILDKVSDYNPDIVGDIHHLPFEDNTVDAIICMAVLEHVEDPKKAVEEIYRVLKPGGYCFLNAPFLFYYHPEPGYYGDFYRFTIDGWKFLTRQFSSMESTPIRGPIATAMNLFPLFSKRTGFFEMRDAWLRPHSNQVSGYNVFCVK